jgi:hypothetical protein
MPLDLELLPDHLAICRLPAGSDVPSWAMSGSIHSVSWTKNETSIICMEANVPEDVHSERGWRALMIGGPLSFELTGILVKVAQPLADSGIPIFVLSTFDTDYILVKNSSLEAAVEALIKSGHRVRQLMS